MGHPLAYLVTVAVDVADLCSLHQTMRALHDLVHAPPAEVDAHASLMAARGLSCAMLRRLGEASAGGVVRSSLEVAQYWASVGAHEGQHHVE